MRGAERRRLFWVVLIALVGLAVPVAILFGLDDAPGRAPGLDVFQEVSTPGTSPPSTTDAMAGELARSLEAGDKLAWARPVPLEGRTFLDPEKAYWISLRLDHEPAVDLVAHYDDRALWILPSLSGTQSAYVVGEGSGPPVSWNDLDDKISPQAHGFITIPRGARLVLVRISTFASIPLIGAVVPHETRDLIVKHRVAVDASSIVICLLTATAGIFLSIAGRTPPWRLRCGLRYLRGTHRRRVF